MADHGRSPHAADIDGELPAFFLPELPYAYDALEPAISARALEIHHSKHHARYVETMNRVLVESQTVVPSVEEAIRTAARRGQVTLFNNAAQAWNHAFFWHSMDPQASQPQGELAAAINATFGGVEALRKSFSAEGLAHFGSGWVWLAAQGRELVILSTHDGQTPIAKDSVLPLLTCDVWEHAYYLDYQQDRARWLATWWDQLANWRFAERQYEAALGRRDTWHYPLTSNR